MAAMALMINLTSDLESANLLSNVARLREESNQSVSRKETRESETGVGGYFRRGKIGSILSK